MLKLTHGNGEPFYVEPDKISYVTTNYGRHKGCSGYIVVDGEDIGVKESARDIALYLHNRHYHYGSEVDTVQSIECKEENPALDDIYVALRLAREYIESDKIKDNGPLEPLKPYYEKLLERLEKYQSNILSVTLSVTEEI